MTAFLWVQKLDIGSNSTKLVKFHQYEAGYLNLEDNFAINFNDLKLVCFYWEMQLHVCLHRKKLFPSRWPEVKNVLTTWDIHFFTFK